MDSLLRTVSYDASVPVASPPASAVAPTENVPVNAGTNFAEKAGSLRQAVGDGLRNTAVVLLSGVFKIVESILDFGDDDDDDFSPRGGADRSFNRWLDDRDRWRRDG